MSSEILVRDLKKSYPARSGGESRTVFDGLGMTVRAGELVGPSGCGKSTLRSLVARRTSRRAATSPSNTRRRHRPERGLPAARLVDWLTVEQNVQLVFERERRPAGDARQIAAGLLARVQLQDHGAIYPQFLSGGQKQRVAIARAFAIRPDVLLLLDEPFSALDELTARRLRLLLQELWMDESRPRPTGILVTHNMMEAAFLVDRIYVMGSQGGQPAHFSAVIDVDCPRPRDPDDPALFAVHGEVMKALAH